MKVVLTGGGTGGHIYPAISAGEALRDVDAGVELLFVGSSHGPEGRLAENAGIPFKAVHSSPLTKALSVRNAVSFGRLAAGFFRARRIVKAFGPDVVIGTGGYTTAAVLLAQRSLGGKIVIHEQNAVPGRTNLFLSRIADRVCVTFDSSGAFFPSKKVVVTGMPIRKAFAALPAKTEARRVLGLDVDRFTVLVVGGSQGARKLNEMVLGAWRLLDEGSVQVIHQAGERNVEEVRAAASEFGPGYKVEAYLDTALAMAAADLLVCRCGASTLAEATAAGLPCLLVPYPYAYANHQKRNAEYISSHGAGVLCEEATCNAEALADLIGVVRLSPDKLDGMRSASAALGKPDAARQVAETAVSVADR